MSGIVSAPLSKVCLLVTDGTHDSPRLQGGGVPFIKGKHISGGRIDFGNCDFISEKDHLDACRRVKPQRGDVLFSNIGSVGDTALVDSDLEFSIKNVALLRADPEVLDPSFFYYLVLSPRFRDGLLNTRSGAAQPFISLVNLRAYETSFPACKTEQRRIAGILSAYDDLIENCQRRIRILEEMARRLYREWFVHFRYPGHESIPLVDSPLGPIPQGWEVKMLGDLAREVRDNVQKGDLAEPTPYVGLEHIPRRSLALDDWETATELGSNKLAFKHGDVLFGKIRPYFHKVSVAPFDGLCSADTIVIRPLKPMHEAIVIAVTSSDNFVAEATASSNGSKMPRANWHIMKTYQVPVPPASVLAKFSDFIRAAVSEQQVLIKQSANLRRTRDLLLPRLLGGS